MAGIAFLVATWTIFLACKKWSTRLPIVEGGERRNRLRGAGPDLIAYKETYLSALFSDHKLDWVKFGYEEQVGVHPTLDES